MGTGSAVATTSETDGVPSVSMSENGTIKPAPMSRLKNVSGDTTQAIVSDSSQDIVVHDFSDGSEYTYTTSGAISASLNDTEAPPNTPESSSGARQIKSAAPDGDRSRIDGTTNCRQIS